MNRLEQRFATTENHIELTHQAHEYFPREAAIVVRLIKHLYREIQDQANQELKPWELNHPEFNVLMMLYGTLNRAMTPSELGECSGEKLANITRLTNRLCDKGLIERTPSDEDGRKTVLSMTSEGISVVEDFLPPISDLLTRNMGTLTLIEQQMLELLLKKMLAGLDTEENRNTADVFSAK